MLKDLFSFFLKPVCLLCDRPASSLLCEDCQRQLKQYQSPCPAQFWTTKIPLFVWGNYEGDFKRAITTLKYQNHPQLGQEFGIWLGEAWLKSNRVSQKSKYTVIPIPLHPKRLQERGFNQAEAIAQGFCRVTRYPLLPHGLKRIRDTAKMFELSPIERQKNVANCFRLSKEYQDKPPPYPILLIDDIYTTGATITEAIRAIEQHHLPWLGVATLATPLRNVRKYS